MGALSLTREDYKKGIEQVNNVVTDNNGAYLDNFKINFPDGLNTVNALEICRYLTDDTLDSKEKLMRLCILGKNVSVTCPNGETEKFCINSVDDNLNAFDLFIKEPFALIAISDSIYGYLLKKYLRPSNKAKGTGETKDQKN